MTATTTHETWTIRCRHERAGVRDVRKLSGDFVWLGPPGLAVVFENEQEAHATLAFDAPSHIKHFEVIPSTLLTDKAIAGWLDAAAEAGIIVSWRQREPGARGIVGEITWAMLTSRAPTRVSVLNRVELGAYCAMLRAAGIESN